MPRGSRAKIRRTPRAWKIMIFAVGTSVAMGVKAGSPALSTIADVPLPGGATRFDYQSLDPKTRKLYLSHMGDGELVVFDTQTRTVTTHLPGFPTVTGVLAVPELHRVFASVAGNHEVAVMDTETLKVVARVPAGQFTDAVA